MSKSKIIIGIVVLIVLAVQGFIYYSIPKIAYVDSELVFNEFKLKKELEQDLEKIKSGKLAALDSIKFDLQLKYSAAANTKNEKEMLEYKMYEQQYFLKEKQYNNEYDIQAAQYTKEIWKQLNQYVNEFGVENGYTYIYGLRGDGELMYGKPDKNISKELIQAINQKYEGIKK